MKPAAIAKHRYRRRGPYRLVNTGALLRTNQFAYPPYSIIHVKVDSHFWRPPRSLRDRFPARRRRHGGGLSGARREAQS